MLLMQGICCSSIVFPSSRSISQSALAVLVGPRPVTASLGRMTQDPKRAKARKGSRWVLKVTWACRFLSSLTFTPHLKQVHHTGRGSAQAFCREWLPAGLLLKSGALRRLGFLFVLVVFWLLEP